MLTLEEFLTQAHELWPPDGAEAWDASGLVAGIAAQPVQRVLVAVDAVDATVTEAIDGDYDVLLTHHPLLLRGVTSIAADRYKGALLTRLVQANCALLAAHTNADVVDDGASGILARELGLRQVEVIVPSVGTSDARSGLGRIGELPEALSLGELARLLTDLLPATAAGIRGAGEWMRPISRIAICSGAGDSLLSHPLVRGADVYITADLRHHPAQEAREQALLGGGPALLDLSHWASEWLWCERAAEQLRERLPDIEINVSDLRTDPWDFVVIPTAERPE